MNRPIQWIQNVYTPGHYLIQVSREDRKILRKLLSSNPLNTRVQYSGCVMSTLWRSTFVAWNTGSGAQLVFLFMCIFTYLMFSNENTSKARSRNQLNWFCNNKSIPRLIGKASCNRKPTNIFDRTKSSTLHVLIAKKMESKIQIHQAYRN